MNPSKDQIIAGLQTNIAILESATRLLEAGNAALKAELAALKARLARARIVGCSQDALRFGPSDTDRDYFKRHRGQKFLVLLAEEKETDDEKT